MSASSSWPWSSCTDMPRNEPYYKMQGILKCSNSVRSCNLWQITPQCRYWLRSSVSLVTIMGLTWIVGVLVFEVPALLPLAYIFTIFVAFQGVAIFVLFVLLDKPVREAYSKWWKARVKRSEVIRRIFGDLSLTEVGNQHNHGNTGLIHTAASL